MPEIHCSDGSVRHGETLRPPRLPALGLDGMELTFIQIDHQTRLRLGETEIVIATPFDLELDRGPRTLDPERRAELGPLLAIYPATLASGAVGADLTLRLTFDHGATISVPQHPTYESWHVVGPGSRLIVCPPAGDGSLAVWQ